ncbi:MULTISPECIES: hypothetical protein [unclassified Streptomyces]|uniref:hypothetical protein n=1 Tax=unclassified Streptomyces TaxID=2593676 RepID=UPI001F172FA8|nr:MULTISPECIES: hypothetical protein [unclassified Streptomyces]MCF0086686.1 hypothetical protein [Streptomyces sp. MH192]MCF0098840.1 hypothetical protein [Streptomyces sp. MH191]
MAEPTPITDSPHFYLAGLAQQGRYAYDFAKAGRTAEALEHTEAIERLITAWRTAIDQHKPPTDQTAEGLASPAVNAGRAPQDEKRHYQIAARLRATVARVRRLHDALNEETALTSPDDEITRSAAARKIAAALDGWTDPAELRRLADEPATPDTLPEWLYQRFAKYRTHAPAWSALTDDDQSYWVHEAAAVRRAVARGGFKRPADQSEPAQQP